MPAVLIHSRKFIQMHYQTKITYQIGKLLLLGLSSILVMVSCSPVNLQERKSEGSVTKTETQITKVIDETPFISPSPSPSSTSAISQTPTENPTPTRTSTNSPSLPNTSTPTLTPTTTLTPTYAVLRGKVLQQANCRYGPGAPYLYKYGVYPGTVLEIIGRTDSGTWVVVQAVGGTNPCWVKADLIEIRGNVMAVAPMYLELPRSPYYGAMTGISASRSGDEVTISWTGIQLRPGDDSEQTPYVIEAWLCQERNLVFTPIGSYGFSTTLIDEAGCDEKSHGRITAAEKHGYTAWVEIPWPPHEKD